MLLDVGQWWVVRLLLAALGLGWLWVRLKRARDDRAGAARTERYLFHAFIIFLFIRFAVPVAMIANEALYRMFLESRFVESTQVIESAGADIREAGVRETGVEEDENLTLMESLGRSFDSARQSMDLKQRVERIGERASDIIEHLIQLSVVFILQTGVLPIAFLWIFLQLFRQLFQNRP